MITNLYESGTNELCYSIEVSSNPETPGTIYLGWRGPNAAMPGAGHSTLYDLDIDLSTAAELLVGLAAAVAEAVDAISSTTTSEREPAQ